MIRAGLGEIRRLGRIVRKQSGSRESRVDAGDLRIEMLDRRLCIRDPAAQGSELDTLFCGGPAQIGTPGAGPVAACSAIGGFAACAAFGEHKPSVLVEIAVERRSLAVGHQHQAIGAGLDQMTVVRHQDHGARIGIDRCDERGAAIDIEMIGRLVEHEEMRPRQRGEAQQQSRLFSTGEFARRRIGEGLRKTHRSGARAHLGLRGIRHEPAQVPIGAVSCVQFVELMLGEIADLQSWRPDNVSGHRCKTPGQELHQCRLSVAVGAQERDAVSVIDAKRKAPQHRQTRLISDRDIVERYDWRRQGLRRRRDLDRPHFVGDQRRDRLELGQQFDARLRLTRLGCLGAKAIDEGLQPLALGVDPFGELEIKRLALAKLALESAVAAAVERELAGLQVQDPGRPRCRGGRDRG